MLGRLLEKRYAFQNLWGSGALFDRGTAAGVQVSQDKSLALSAVYACVRLISDTISTLPVDQFIRTNGQRRPYRPREEWVVDPNPFHPRTTFYQQVLVSLLLDGNAFVYIVRNDDGSVDSLDVLNPTKVEVSMVNGDLAYTHTGPEGTRVLTRENILHLTELLLPGDLRGVSRIHANRENLGLALALQDYAAAFFGNGAYAGGVLEVPGEPNPEQLTQMVDAWEGRHRGVRRAHRPAVLYGGAKFVATSVNPSDSQLMQERQFAVEEVARLFRVPLFSLGVSTPGAVSYASVEQQNLHFLTHTIQPVVAVLEDAFSTLLTDRRTFIKFNLSSLVRADLATRTASYASALISGYMSVNDVRALEDQPPVPDGDSYRVPLQNIPTTDTPIITLNERAKALGVLVTAGFTPSSAAAVVGIEGLEHTGLASVQLQQDA
jgi:HK97 family phage portal protein